MLASPVPFAMAEVKDFGKSAVKMDEPARVRSTPESVTSQQVENPLPYWRSNRRIMQRAFSNERITV